MRSIPFVAALGCAIGLLTPDSANAWGRRGGGYYSGCNPGCLPVVYSPPVMYCPPVMYYQSYQVPSDGAAGYGGDSGPYDVTMSYVPDVGLIVVYRSTGQAYKYNAKTKIWEGFEMPKPPRQ